MKLIHISDLHCGINFDKNVFDTAADEINSLKPDAIVITGDLTEEGYLKEYRLAKDLLKKFDCNNIIIGSGNHDYKHTGYFLFSKFFPTKSRKEVCEFDNYLIIMARTARPDRIDGEVGYRQILWMEERFKECSDKFKIVGMHHHLIPVPDTGIERNIVADAGDVLRSFVQNKVDLVLCGHKHRPWKWDIHKLTIINAGTLSCNKFRGFFANSYNIITINNGGIDSRVKIVGGETLEFYKILKGYQGLNWLE